VFSRLNFKGSFKSLQPMPDSFMTWLTQENNFVFTGNAAIIAQSYGLTMSSIVLPFNKFAPVAAAFPGPFSAIATQNPTGMTNLLFNTLTNTGIYNGYRVWSTQVEIETSMDSSLAAGSLADSLFIAMAPLVATAGVAYPSVQAIGSGPNSLSATVVSGTGSKILRDTYSMPKLAGCPPSQYATLSDQGSYATDPGFGTVLQFGWASSNGLAPPTTTNYCFRVKLRFHVEFTRRNDSALRAL